MKDSKDASIFTKRLTKRAILTGMVLPCYGPDHRAACRAGICLFVKQYVSCIYMRTMMKRHKTTQKRTLSRSTYTFRARIFIRGQDDALHQHEVPSAKIVKWYEEVLQSPYCTDRLRPSHIRVLALGERASDGIRISFRLQHEREGTVITRDDVRLFKQMLADPDDDGNHPLHASRAVRRARVSGKIMTTRVTPQKTKKTKPPAKVRIIGTSKPRSPKKRIGRSSRRSRVFRRLS